MLRNCGTLYDGLQTGHYIQPKAQEWQISLDLPGC